MGTSTEYLEGFIENNYKSQINSDIPLTEQELKTVALELGCKEAEWNARLNDAQLLYNTADDFLGSANFYAAERAIDEAIAINPSKAEYFVKAGEIQLKIASKAKNSKSLNEALNKTEQALLINPRNKKAILLQSKIISRLKSTTSHSELTTTSIVLISLGLLSILLIAVLTF